jgi:hypothetical protein
LRNFCIIGPFLSDFIWPGVEDIVKEISSENSTPLPLGQEMACENRFPLVLPECRESALRATRAMVGGAAQGRGRPSDDG